MTLSFCSWRRFRRSILIAAIMLLGATLYLRNAVADDLLRATAQLALNKAATFFHQTVAIEGGYVFRYSSDLTFQEGEVKTGKSTVWIEPPSTPAVAMAMLEAFQRTGNQECLAAAKDAAECLIRGQLHSGGWSNGIEFDKDERLKNAYRVDGPIRSKARNVTTLDDNKTQACVKFMMGLDQELKFSDERIHQATQYVLEALLEAQYPNGGWPQGFSQAPNREDFPIVKASYPSSWSRTHPNVDYKGYYTLNDNTHVDTLKMMFLAFDIYGDKRYKESAIKGAEFLLLAQMPDPQPAWAQQYNAEMQPAWARRFEPPSVSGGESQKVIDILLTMYQNTSDSRFLESAKRALDYLQKSIRPDGNLVRFYELQSNRPLYFTKDYKLAYDDKDVPTHYGFVISSSLKKLDDRYKKLAALSPSKLSEYAARLNLPRPIDRPDEKTVRKVIEGLDERGAWVQSGKLQSQDSKSESAKIIESKAFIQNLGILSQYLASDR